MKPLGDLAQGFALRQRIGDVKLRMQVLSNELATGLTQDPAAHVHGDLSTIAELDRRMSVLESYRIANDETAQFAQAMQITLERIQEPTQQLSSQLIRSDLLEQDGFATILSGEAKSVLGTVIGAINTSSAGRSLFAGAATDRLPIGNIEDLLTSVRAEISGLTSVTDIRAAVDGWFDMPGGGFETSYYTGSLDYLSPIALSETETANLTIKADDPWFRASLKELTLATLASDPALGFPDVVQNELIKSAGEGLMRQQDEIVETRAQLGALEERIARTVVRLSSERSATEMSIATILGIDDYEAATRLEEVQAQLETIYAITARSSRLTLAEYL